MAKRRKIKVGDTVVDKSGELYEVVRIPDKGLTLRSHTLTRMGYSNSLITLTRNNVKLIERKEEEENV